MEDSLFLKKFLNFENSKTILEKDPLEKACLKSLIAYKHNFGNVWIPKEIEIY